MNGLVIPRGIEDYKFPHDNPKSPLIFTVVAGAMISAVGLQYVRQTLTMENLQNVALSTMATDGIKQPTIEILSGTAVGLLDTKTQHVRTIIIDGKDACKSDPNEQCLILQDGSLDVSYADLESKRMISETWNVVTKDKRTYLQTPTGEIVVQHRT